MAVRDKAISDWLKYEKIFSDNKNLTTDKLKTTFDFEVFSPTHL
jgi:hypothetical protein